VTDERYGRFGSYPRVELERFFHLDDEDPRLSTGTTPSTCPTSVERTDRCVTPTPATTDSVQRIWPKRGKLAFTIPTHLTDPLKFVGAFARGTARIAR
jgi:hypothetical protein